MSCSLVLSRRSIVVFISYLCIFVALVAAGSEMCISVQSCSIIVPESGKFEAE